MTREEILDIYFMDARARLIDLAAFVDRVGRSSGGADFRMQAFSKALAELSTDQPHKTIRVLRAFSDLTTEPIAKATMKGATGAWSTQTPEHALH
jgi:hypothetical protein